MKQKYVRKYITYCNFIHAFNHISIIRFSSSLMVESIILSSTSMILSIKNYKTTSQQGLGMKIYVNVVVSWPVMSSTIAKNWKINWNFFWKKINSSVVFDWSKIVYKNLIRFQIEYDDQLGFMNSFDISLAWWKYDDIGNLNMSGSFKIWVA